MTNKQEQALRKCAAAKLRETIKFAQDMLPEYRGMGDGCIEYEYAERGSYYNKKGQTYYELTPGWLDGTIRLYTNSDLTVWRIELQLGITGIGYIIIKGKDYNLLNAIHKWFQDSTVVKDFFTEEDVRREGWDKSKK
jgi:hypothetical protein